MSITPLLQTLDSVQGATRIREDDSRKRTEAEIAADVTPVNYAYPPYTPKRYGALADGVTDDWDAIRLADLAGSEAGVAVMFQGGVYGVNCSAHSAALSQTVSWIAEPGAQVTIRRLDFTASVAYFTMRQEDQEELALSGIDFDGQLTTAASSLPNVDLAAAGSYSDTSDESLWRKVFGVDIYNATNAYIENCNFRNFLRAGLWIRGDGLATSVSDNVRVSNCTVSRTRSGSGGDSFWIGGATDVKFVNCHAYDYQRIGFVCEFAADSATDCRDISFTNCTADFGHDVVAPETNAGFWVEAGDNIMCVNCTSKNTACGFVANAGSQTDTGTTRPFVSSLKFINCVSLRSKICMRMGFGGSRDIHLSVTDFFGEADQDEPAYAGESLGLRAGILLQFVEDAAGRNFRADFKNIRIHALNQSTGVASNGFGCIRIAQGTVTAPQQLVVTVDGLQTQWSVTDGTDDVDAKTDYESVTNGYFGDVVLSGANDTSPDGRFKGHLSLSRIQNHTFGYAMMSMETASSGSNITITDSRFSVRKASLANNGILTIANCPLVDFRGNVGFHKIMASNSTIEDADTGSTDHVYIAVDLAILGNCHVKRRLLFDLQGGDATHRKFRFQSTGCTYDIPLDSVPALQFSLGDGLYAHVQLNGNTFRNTSASGSTDTTDVIIRVQTATGTCQISGSGNLFDKAFVDDDGHLVEYNSTPTYNDDPTTVATPFITPLGALALFDPI